MKFGLFAANMGACADPVVAAKVAVAAEAAGFDSLWTGEHVVLPDPQVPPSPARPDTPLLDPAVALAFLAAHTRTIRLGTGIIILPQRNPLVLANELASVDVLSRVHAACVEPLRGPTWSISRPPHDGAQDVPSGFVPVGYQPIR